MRSTGARARTAVDRYGLVVAAAVRISPIFPVRDVRAALAFYEGLGFTTRSYPEAAYGFAVLDGVELHLGGPPHQGEPAPHGAHLHVDDADELAARWATI